MFVLKDERDPHGLDEAEQPLQILLNAVLIRPFSLTDANRDLTDLLLEYLDELDQDSDLLSAWQRTSFYEWIISRFQEQESTGFQTVRELFSALFRSNKGFARRRRYQQFHAVIRRKNPSSACSNSFDSIDLQIFPRPKNGRRGDSRQLDSRLGPGA
jgi:hypothetical protein